MNNKTETQIFFNAGYTIFAFIVFHFLYLTNSNGQTKFFDTTNNEFSSSKVENQNDSSNVSDPNKYIEKINVLYPLTVGICAGLLVAKLWPDGNTSGGEGLNGLGELNNILQFFGGFAVGFILTSVILEQRMNRNKNDNDSQNYYSSSHGLNYIEDRNNGTNKLISLRFNF